MRVLLIALLAAISYAQTGTEVGQAPEDSQQELKVGSSFSDQCSNYGRYTLTKNKRCNKAGGWKYVLDSFTGKSVAQCHQECNDNPNCGYFWISANSCRLMTWCRTSPLTIYVGGGGGCSYVMTRSHRFEKTCPNDATYNDYTLWRGLRCSVGGKGGHNPMQAFSDLTVPQCKKKCDDDQRCGYFYVSSNSCQLYTKCTDNPLTRNDQYSHGKCSYVLKPNPKYEKECANYADLYTLDQGRLCQGQRDLFAGRLEPAICKKRCDENPSCVSFDISNHYANGLHCGLSSTCTSPNQNSAGGCFFRMTAQRDCAGTPNGNLVDDECGVCGGSGILPGKCDCAGNVNDECGVCGGPGILQGNCDCAGNVDDECGVCGGPGILQGNCDCAGNVDDECGVCGGPGILPGKCDCAGNVNDDCGVCGGPGILPGNCDCAGNVNDVCGVCGGPGILPGNCDCAGNVNDVCGVCGGPGIPQGNCDCAGNVNDVCGVCGGPGILQGQCDCAGNVNDVCGMCGGPGILPGKCDCVGNVDLGCGCGLPGPSGCDQECNSNAVVDVCGVCGGPGILAGKCDCEGNVDLGCGCGLPGPSGCDQECNSNAVEDVCGVCGGSGILEGKCDCDGNVDLGCGCGEPGPSGCDGVCDSNAVEDVCGVCGGPGILEGKCDCDGNVDLGCGCGLPEPSGCDNVCNSNAVEDVCGVCGGPGILEGKCDCKGNVDHGCGCGLPGIPDGACDCDGHVDNGCGCGEECEECTNGYGNYGCYKFKYYGYCDASHSQAWMTTHCCEACSSDTSGVKPSFSITSMETSPKLSAFAAVGLLVVGYHLLKACFGSSKTYAQVDNDEV